MNEADNLEEQHSNIIQNNFQKILSFQEAKPTLLWKKQTNESYDELYEEEKTVEEVVSHYENEYSFLRKMDKILNEYLNIISIVTKEADAKKIYFSTKETVLKINNINKKHGSIHTGQREDLCQFFEDVVRGTGFILKDNTFTDEWREW